MSIPCPLIKNRGYNFCVLTCHSCRTFFRRNGLNDYTQSLCKAGDKCVITVENRRHCQKCRLKKCFEVGMKRQLKCFYGILRMCANDQIALVKYSCFEIQILKSTHQLVKH
ncbi:unnamed protein product [Medioppia subpectinata]|uniref:Nuclear receptor domain-containing protein n=1 Tax=Medioppia subpectinata TaxID=1979941 RepID=A0A7R9KDK1_9ACAR|nr:unnamed protein product [Medioppia subpectinata]CAG2101541.1 unnamed protein product [Medioppia subpectinata]